MSTCAWCQKAKAKRNCPAIGAICATCCGKHRQREITCPESCFYLRRTVKTIDAAFKNAYRKLIDYTLTERGDANRSAVEAWLDDPREIHEWEQESFLGYLAYGHVTPNGERNLDIFLRDHAHRLSTDELTALSYLKHTWISLFEVLAVRANEGLQLLDLFSNEKTFVHEKLGTRATTEGDLLLAWIVKMMDHNILTGAATPIPPQHERVVLETIEQELERVHNTANANVPTRQLLRLTIPVAHRALRKAIRDWTPPKVFTPEGQEVAHCRATYEVTDPDAARSTLRADPKVKQITNNRFVWIADQQPGSDHSADLFLDAVEIRTVRLTLETISKERLHRRRRILEKRLGDLIRHRFDQIEDLETLSKKRPTVSDSLHGSGPWPGTEPPDFADPARILQQGLSGLYSGEGTGDTKPHAEVRPKGEVPETVPVENSHRLPLTAHEAMKQLVPRLGSLIARVTRKLGKAVSTNSRFVLTPEKVGEIEPVMDFLYAFAQSKRDGGLSSDAALNDTNLLGSHLFYLLNFELHYRKLFWVTESLAWMLGQTSLDIQGESLRLPFPACAFVFTDPFTLEIGESLLSQDYECRLRNQKLRILTIYVIETTRNNGRQGLHIYLLFDSGDGQWPYMLARDLFIGATDNLDAILDSHFPEVSVDSLDPIFLAPELKKLVHLLINAILYSTYAHLDPIVLPPALRQRDKAGKQRKHETKREKGVSLSSENVFYLPGKIEISHIRHLSRVEKTHEGRRILKRFMVRGHWRKALPNWKDQRLRWIEPYWKGPDITTIIEREYRLKP